MKKTLALLLAVVMVLALFAGCAPKVEPKTDEPKQEEPKQEETKKEEPKKEETKQEEPTEPEGPVIETFEGNFTYQDSVSTMATNWNPHTYQTTDDSYPADFLRVGLYSFIFNDELHPVEGKEPFAGYVIVPEMAAEKPVDVTEKIRAQYPQFNIPESATAGYAYTIALNPNATWEDGTPINADTYVYSMQKLLDPKLLNYRASDYYAGDLCIAGAEAYANGGNTAYTDNGVGNFYTMAELTLGEDGNYVGPEGEKMYIGLAFALDWTGGDTLKDYVEAYGDAYFDVTNWEALAEQIDENGLIPLNDANLELFTPVTCGNPAWGETADDLPNYFVYGVDYPEIDYDGNVGCFKSGDYEITLVFGKSLAGFNLLYNLSSNWIVYKDLYESCLKETEGVWSSTYNTSVETTMSYGPYKMTEYQTDKFMKFDRNENWYGYTDGQHIYVDPEDGLYYPMYQTTSIECEVVEEANTRKLMFLKGELMGYGLQADDFATYRNSDYVYFTPSETIFFLILNGYLEALQNREAAEDFDQAATDLEMLSVKTFKQAIAVTYDKELFASTVSPARSGGYGIIGSAYIYDPDTGARYRDTDQAKQALCNFYNVDVSKFANLTDAAASITGYDPEAAKELFAEAFKEGLELGYITDADNDGKCDQVVTIEYSLSSDSDFMTRTVNYLNEKMAEVTEGTPFEGKINFYKSAPYGNDWSTKIKNGLSDTVLGGWSGSALNPFSLSDLYVNPSYAYDANWFDATKVDMTLTVGGEEITTNIRNWSDALNGATVNINGKDYNWGDGIADVETRLDILAALENVFLQSYDYIPMLQDAGAALLSQQVFYVVDEYNPIMGRGGITYMKYNYDDAEWVAYVASCGGELQY